MIQYKETKKLFLSKYHYKIVLLCQGCYEFRDKTLNSVRRNLSKHGPFMDPEELDYSSDVLKLLEVIKDFSLRIEYPWLTVYSNNRLDIDTLANIDNSRVKYVSLPTISLAENEIVMTNTPYQYRVTISSGAQDCSAFVEWAVGNKNVKLSEKTKITLLSRKYKYSQSVFYITGDSNLLLAKVHLGSGISKIEKIVTHDTV